MRQKINSPFLRLTLNPLLGPPRLFISSLFEGDLVETVDLFHLEKTIISVLHKELQYKVKKLKKMKF